MRATIGPFQPREQLRRFFQMTYHPYVHAQPCLQRYSLQDSVIFRRCSLMVLQGAVGDWLPDTEEQALPPVASTYTATSTAELWRPRRAGQCSW
jgi:hypothetical protein